jgi:hypothetical protein
MNWISSSSQATDFDDNFDNALSAMRQRAGSGYVDFIAAPRLARRTGRSEQ